MVKGKQDGIELGQAQLKLKLGFTSTNWLMFEFWTSISDLPTLKTFVQTFFLGESMAQNNLPT